ncbi:MAG: histidinol dehydrogenase [Clostridiales bacterium]|nr:histidinol dehydrogenase [Clostridiales bacterium]
MEIIKYDSEQGKQLFNRLLNRSKQNEGKFQETVDEILKNIKQNGNKAVFEYTKKFDGFDVNENNFKVTRAEIKKAYAEIDPELVEVMEHSAERISAYHQKQKLNSWLEPNEKGEMLGQLIRPLERVGVYVPGGKAAYPSSVLMNIIPAKVAGVKKIIMTTPADKNGNVNPNTLAAADIAGADEIYKVGGAQAIGALAYGTETIGAVDKIVGPGNIFVALAKKSVYGSVNIDSVAGPSEILVIADESADPVFVSADLLSQAEHDELASAILITTDISLAEKVNKEIYKQAERLERKEIILKSLEGYGGIVVAPDIKTACELSNKIAPEHLEVSIKEPFSALRYIKNAGAVFLGHYSPEPLGDYMAGPNHVLPTGGTARFFSPLSIDDYIKKSSIISFSKEALFDLGDDIITFAEAEGLTAHANSVKVRMNKG